MSIKRHRQRHPFTEALEPRRLLAAEIEGFVWNDWNQDGEREKSSVEYRVADVTVNLLTEQLQIVETAQTDEDGTYGFRDVDPGRYRLEFVAPDGTVFTRPFAARRTKDSDPDPTTGRTNVFQVNQGDQIDDIDAGVFAQFGTADLTGTVWHDRNADGLRGKDEPRIANAEVQLENLLGENLTEVLTDEDGRYLIPGHMLLPGEYVVDFVRPDGDEPRWQISPKQASEELVSHRDSDANILNGKTDPFTLEATLPGAERDTIRHSAGFFRSATISGSVWHDRDRNGNPGGSGEFGVQNIAVDLLDPLGRLIDRVKTDRNGKYTLVVPTPGDYFVRFQRSVGTALTMSQDGTGIEVDPLTGRTSLVSIEALQQISDVSAGIFSPNGTDTISGRVWHDLNANGFQDPSEPGVPRAEVQLENTSLVKLMEVRTNAMGEFSFDGAMLLPGEYHLDFKRPNRIGPLQGRWQISPRNEAALDSTLDNDAQPTNGKTPPISLAALDDGEARDSISRDAAFFQYATVGGVVGNDVNLDGQFDPEEPKLPGVKVRLLDRQQKTLRTATTDAQGVYQFDRLIPSNEYTVEFHAPTDTTFRSATRTTDDLLNVNLLNGKSQRFIPTSDQRSIASIGLAGKSTSASILGYAWNDQDADGIQDSNEPGQPGVEVTLRRVDGGRIASTVSAADGQFAFEQLNPAGYILEFLPPDGTTITRQNRGDDDSRDSDVNRFSRHSAVIPIAAGQLESSVDVGIFSGSLSTDVIGSLRITEVGFIGHGNAEFAEIKNIGAEPLDLTGVAFTSGIRFDFDDAETKSLFPGEHAIVLGNRALLSGKDNAVGQRFDLDEINVAGVYRGDLNRQENMTLKDRHENVVTSFRYDDSWFIVMDDEYEAWTLTVVDESADTAAWDSKSNWRASSFLAGTPGFDDPKITPDPGAVVVNEVLPKSADGFNDLIEIHNTTDADIDIGYWYLGDSGRQGEVEPLIKRTRYRIAPNTILPADGYLVFSRETHFGNSEDPGLNYPFGLSSFGEAVHIISADKYGRMTGYSDSASFPSAEVGMSFGRQVLSDGSTVFAEMATPSFGAANPQPVVHDLVIDALLYQPDRDAEEFIRLHNAGDTAIQLSDASGAWSLGDAVDYHFTDEATIEAGQRIFVVPTEPVDFRQKYGVPEDIQIFGPYDGALDNRGEQLSLFRPGTAGRDLLADRVTYNDEAPWPTAATTGNVALMRRSTNVLGQEPTNWVVSTDSVTDLSRIGLFLRPFTETAADAIYGHDMLGTFVDHAVPGDANVDTVFNSKDLIEVFVAGEYDDGIRGNSDWSEGDWNGDGDFDSRDLLLAFQKGHFAAFGSESRLAAEIAASLESRH